MNKELQLQSIEKAKGRPMLQWVGKKPLEKVEYYPAQEKEIYGDVKSQDFNKLFWGDNLQVLAHLLKEYRGKIDLIYIDPPFDSKADYVRKVKIRSEQFDGQSKGILEEKQYTDIWEKDEYLQFMYERLLLMRELLSDSGNIYLHCDWHKGGYLKLIMDEVFGEDNLKNEIVWRRGRGIVNTVSGQFSRMYDVILFYSKSSRSIFNKSFRPYSDATYKMYKFDDGDGKGKYRLQELRDYSKENIEKFNNEGRIAVTDNGKKLLKQYLSDKEGVALSDFWDDIEGVAYGSEQEKTNYPTQKPEALIKRIIESSTSEGSLVADFFVGSGTTLAVAQKLGRRWIGCDINLGAIQTTTKRLNQIVESQKKTDGLNAFKVLNVNDYEIFKNELEAKSLVAEMYGIEEIKRSYFDGVLDNNFVKIMPMNRVLNKLDVKTLLRNVEEKISDFSVKKESNSGEPIFEQGVIIIASGIELDVSDYLKKENKTGVKIEIRDIQTDKRNLVFKQKPEAKIKAEVKGNKLSVEIEEFYSPILMRKLEIENEKALNEEYKAKVGDFKQIIDSVAIDVDYNGELFNAEIMDLPTKRELIKARYEWDYPKKGKYTVAIKIVDVLGEEYFETIEAVS